MKFTRIKSPDAPQNIRRLPRLGKIRLGLKMKHPTKTDKGGNPITFPKEVDYFVCPPEFTKHFGPYPKELPVRFPVDDEEEFMRQYYAVYGSNHKLKCQGDGEVCERRTEKGIEKLPCPGPKDCEYGQRKENKCRARTDLMVMVPEVSLGGVYQVSTGSVTASIDVGSGLKHVRDMVGWVRMIPFKMIREEVKIPDPETGKMQSHYPVKIFCDLNIEQLNMLISNSKYIVGKTTKYELPEPEIEGEVDHEAIVVTSEEVEPEKEQTSASPPSNEGEKQEVKEPEVPSKSQGLYQDLFLMIADSKTEQELLKAGEGITTIASEISEFHLEMLRDEYKAKAKKLGVKLEKKK